MITLVYFFNMKKSLLPLLVGAGILVPSTSSAQNIQKSKSEIVQTLSFGKDWMGISEQERRQERIQRLVPQIKEPIILWNLRKPEVSITIDDGYWKESIEYMLDLFEKKWVKATFFVIWDCLKLYPSLWKRAVEHWHEICNHTNHHNKYFKTWNESERFESELLWWEKTVKSVLWEDYFVKMKKNFPFFRFPWMHWIRVKAYLDILKKHWYIPIWRWHIKNPENQTVNNGDIFLWHFKNQDTTNVRKSLELALQDGKQPRTVSDIITSDGYSEPIWWHNVYKEKRRMGE